MQCTVCVVKQIVFLVNYVFKNILLTDVCVYGIYPVLQIQEGDYIRDLQTLPKFIEGKYVRGFRS